jgi:hypothetical protein
MMGATSMKPRPEVNANAPPSLWSFILHGNNTKSLVDELIELGVCGLLSSELFKNLKHHTESLMLGFVLIALDQLKDYFGLFKVLLPILLFVLLRSLRFLLRRHKQFYVEIANRYRLFAKIQRGVMKIAGFSQRFGRQCRQILGGIFRKLVTR